MKTLLLILFAVLVTVYAQAQLYKGQSGKVTFFSKAPLENIEAVTGKVGAALNLANGEVAVIISITSFEFDKSLMREHFNDNYMESDKFPTATFQGRIAMNIFPLNVNLEQTVDVAGTLKIHGVSQERTIRVTLKPAGPNQLRAVGKFMVKLEDHKIEIPRLVFQNIAEVVEVSYELPLSASSK